MPREQPAMRFGTVSRTFTATTRSCDLQSRREDAALALEMVQDTDADWLDATRGTIRGYRSIIDSILSQIDDEVLFRRPTPTLNSIAVLLRHIGGNLDSRWRDFLTSDGEKPDRDRDAEFEDWPGTRDELLSYFDHGWQRMTDALDALRPGDLRKTITIRGEPHRVPQAIQRSLTHLSYHVGQIALLARLLRGGDDGWRWLTIPPGGSAAHNHASWGTPASRGAAAEDVRDGK